MKYRDILPRIESVMHFGKAIVITGMRRVGKTTILKYLYDKIGSDNRLFIDLENPIERTMFENEDYNLIKNELELMGIDFSKRHYIFLDEIQYVNNIPSVMKFFMDTYGTRFFVSGSASFYLKNLFSESLSGRKFIFELYPLSFREFLIFKEILPSDGDGIKKALKSNRILSNMRTLFSEYMYFGGFPEVVLTDSENQKTMLLKDMFTSFYQKEILGLADFRKNKELMDLILFIMEHIGGLFDASKIARQIGLSRHTVKEYVKFLRQSYFLYLLPPFSQNKQVEIRKMPKIYLCDCGMLNVFAKLDRGRLFEQAVFQSIRPYAETVNFYRKKTGLEIDFIMDKEIAIEAKLSASELYDRRLHSICRGLGINKRMVIALENVDRLVGIGIGLHK